MKKLVWRRRRGECDIFLPSIKPGESEKDYVARCIPYLIHNEGVPADEASARCHGMYEQHKKKGTQYNDEGVATILFEPPEAGDAPVEVKRILREVYSGCRQSWVDKHPDDRENQANKTMCSQTAWSAVHKAGWNKNSEGKWVKRGQHSGSHELFMLTVNMFEPNDRKDIMVLAEEEYKDATILVGDGTYRGVFFPAEEIKKAYLSWEKQPINLDHSEVVADEVGYLTNVQYDDNTRKLTARPVINNDMPNSKIAKAYIMGRNKAGTIPEVSVGVWMDRVWEEMKDGKTRLTARNLNGDHLALVTRGACSPKAGCGIGLSFDTTIPLDIEDNFSEKEPIYWVSLEEYNTVVYKYLKLELEYKILVEKLKEVKKHG